MEKRMRVVQEARLAGVVDRRQSATGNLRAVERQYFQPATAKIRLQHQSVVSRPQNDAVVLLGHCFKGSFLAGSGKSSLRAYDHLHWVQRSKFSKMAI